MGNWKLENWANGKGLSNARIRTNSECSLQFGTVFSENYSSIRLSSEHSGILAQWRVNIHNHLYKCLRLQNVPYDKCRRTILRCWCRWHPSGSCVFQTNTHWHLKRDHNRIAKKTFVFFFLRQLWCIQCPNRTQTIESMNIPLDWHHSTVGFQNNGRNIKDERLMLDEE